MLPKGKYIVVGLGITGVALLDYLGSQGMQCIGFDELDSEQFKPVVTRFKSCKFYFEKFPIEELQDCQALIVSPGVPLNQAYLQRALQQKIPILGEIELASKDLHGSILAVTGTNGKSTTVSLLHTILQEGGFSSSLKGNIGSPLITAVSEPKKDFYVVELSS